MALYERYCSSFEEFSSYEDFKANFKMHPTEDFNFAYGFKPNKPITRAEFAAIAARFDETQSGKSATFSDVIGHWAAKEIGIAYYNDWIKGYPDGTFKPDQNITRAEAMTLINRVLERKPESPADLLTNMNKWTDNMDTSKWYYLDVQEATNSHGYTRKTFNYELWRQMLPDPDWSRYER